MTSPQPVIPLCSFPSVGWFALSLHENALINLHENYVKQTFRNRIEILTVNGRLSLTLPVEGQRGVKTPVAEIRIAGTKWRSEWWNAIKTAYGRAPYFEYYSDELESIIKGNQQLLLDFNLQSVDFLSKNFKLPVKLNYTCVAPNRADAVQYRFEDHLFEPTGKWPVMPSYAQVFMDRLPFESNLSGIDLLMNKGPASVDSIILIKNSE